MIPDLDRCTVAVMVDQDGASCWVRCGYTSRRFFFSSDFQRVEAACAAHCQEQDDLFWKSYVEISREEAEAYKVHLS